MKLAIMQPYAFPYLGYFQLIHAVDKMILLDDVAWIKRGWINRNWLSSRRGPQRFTFPVAALSRTTRIADVNLSHAEYHRARFMKSIELVYGAAPYYTETLPLIERCLARHTANLTDSIAHMLGCICEVLGIGTPLARASVQHAAVGGKGQERVIGICRAEGATTYLNSEGGAELYDEAEFGAHGIDLRFLVHVPVPYKNNCVPFQPRLSIIDVMMFNSPGAVAQMLQSCRVVKADELG